MEYIPNNRVGFRPRTKWPNGVMQVPQQTRVVAPFEYQYAPYEYGSKTPLWSFL